MAREEIRSELDRVLRSQFNIPAEMAARLGDVIERNASDMGLSPGTMYAGGTQTGPSGQGRAAEKYKNKLAKLFDGIDISKCGQLGNPDCAELLSRLLEQTFRNFQLTARPPSHVAPPYQGQAIDTFVTGVALPVGVPTLVATFVMPAGLFRGEITSLGECLESAFAFTDVRWSVLVDGVPFAPWIGVVGQSWACLPPTPLASPIHLQGQQRISIQATAILAPHVADARIVGWVYPIRANTGGLTAQSTIVD